MTTVAKKKYMSKRKRKLIVDIFSYIVLTLGAFAMIAPFIWMLSTALKKDQFHIYGRKLFDQLYFSNFIKVFKTIPLLEGFKNSVLVAVPSIIVGTFVSGMAAYALRKSSSNLKQRSFCCCWE